MKTFTTKKLIFNILGVVFFFLIWWFISSLFDKNSMIFPSPLASFKAMIELLKNKITYVYLGHTVLKTLIGFLVSFILALILGIIGGLHENIYDFFNPIMTVLKSIPTVTLVYLFIIIVKPLYSPIYVVVLICLPILYESVSGGFKNIDGYVLKAAKIDGASKLKTIFSIRIPLSLPYIAVGVASSLALSFKLEIMAEVLTGITKNGIGAAISALQGSEADLTKVFGYSLIIIILVLLLSLVSTITKEIIVKKTKRSI